MILDGICYPVIHSGRVILYVWSSPPVVSLSLTSALLYLRLLLSPASIDASLSTVHGTLSIIRSSYNLFKTL